jgi:hypothetical protein
MMMKQPETEPDLSSVASIKAAFDERRPAIEPATDESFPEDPTPEEQESIESFARFLRAAMPIVLGTEAAAAPRAFSSWSPEQRAFLEEIAKVPEEAHIDADSLSAMLSKLGAIDVGPNGDDCYLRRYVGLAQPSALESEVGGLPLWLTLRFCLMGKLDPDVWRQRVAGLGPSERLDLARRATMNAYQLMRRWPLPREITPEVEREDASRLYELLLPMLEPLTAAERKAAISSEEAAQVPRRTFVLLLSISQASHGEPITASPETLTAALTLFSNTTLGMRFLTSLPADERRALIQAIELMPNNLNGWSYLDLLDADDRQRAVIETLAGFKRPAKSSVANHISKLIQSFDDPARAELRKLIANGGPNAKAIEAALGKKN